MHAGQESLGRGFSLLLGFKRAFDLNAVAAALGLNSPFGVGGLLGAARAAASLHPTRCHHTPILWGQAFGWRMTQGPVQEGQRRERVAVAPPNPPAQRCWGAEAICLSWKKELFAAIQMETSRNDCCGAFPLNHPCGGAAFEDDALGKAGSSLGWHPAAPSLQHSPSRARHSPVSIRASLLSLAAPAEPQSRSWSR